jgi:hypothetical protein
MQLARSASTAHPRFFGRGPLKDPGPAAERLQKKSISDDLKLFATTFAAGFIFVTVLFA